MEVLGNGEKGKQRQALNNDCSFPIVVFFINTSDAHLVGRIGDVFIIHISR